MVRSLLVFLIVLTGLFLSNASPLRPIVLPHNGLIAALQATNASTGLPEASVGAPYVECHGDKYGDDLDLSSCRQLVEKQIPLTGPETFAPRRPPSFDVPAAYPTPFLFSSRK